MKVTANTTFDHLLEHHVNKNVSTSSTNSIITMHNDRACLAPVTFVNFPKAENQLSERE